MPQSLGRIIVHLVFSTKNRQATIPAELCDELSAYLGGILKRADCTPIEINCVSDHAHALFCLSKNTALAEAVKEAKKGSSAWMKTKAPELRDFYWQNGYGAGSVSPSNVDRVRAYIRDQQKHHAKTTFQDEMRAFLRRHGIEFDERYVWD